jgi:hypothetical protein
MISSLKPCQGSRISLRSWQRCSLSFCFIYWQTARITPSRRDLSRGATGVHIPGASARIDALKVPPGQPTRSRCRIKGRWWRCLRSPRMREVHRRGNAIISTFRMSHDGPYQVHSPLMDECGYLSTDSNVRTELPPLCLTPIV